MRAPLFNRVVLLIDHTKPENIPSAHKDKAATGEGPTLYLCRNFTCDTPVSGMRAIRAVIEKEARRLE